MPTALDADARLQLPRMTSDIEARIASVRRKYADLGLRLKSNAFERTVRSFESTYGITLPEDYRRFVLVAGNGGDGPPLYGLAPVQRSDQNSAGSVWPGFSPATEFSLREPWLWDNDPEVDESVGGPVDRVHKNGHIYLGTHGCGIECVLITAGPERGNVWLISGEGAKPESDGTGRLSFLDWIETWLNSGKATKSRSPGSER